MKVIVDRTKKSCMMDPETHTVFDRPVLARETEFLRQRVFARDLVALTPFRFPDEASNDEFQAFVKDSGGNLELAVASFQSKYDGTAVEQPEPAQPVAAVDADEPLPPVVDATPPATAEVKKTETKAERKAREAQERLAAKAAAAEQK